MKYFSVMLAILISLLVGSLIQAAPAIEYAQLLFPARDEQYETVLLTVSGFGDPQYRLTIQDQRGGPAIAIKIPGSPTEDRTLMIHLPLVAADQLQDRWPVRIRIQNKADVNNANVDIPLTRDTQNAYRLLVIAEPAWDAELMSRVISRPLQVARFADWPPAAVLSADGVVLPNSSVTPSQLTLIRTMLAGGADMWVRGSTPPVFNDASFVWQKMTSEPRPNDRTLWRIRASSGQLPVILPSLSALPFSRPALSNLIARVVDWLPVITVVMIASCWLMTRRTWRILLLMSIVLPLLAIIAIYALQITQQPNLESLNFAESQTNHAPACRHQFISVASLLNSSVVFPGNPDLPVIPLAGDRPQWFGMRRLTISFDSEINHDAFTLPARQRLVMYSRSLYPDMPGPDARTLTFVRGMIAMPNQGATTSQTWEQWLVSLPPDQQKNWRAWWLAQDRQSYDYRLKPGEMPLIWPSEIMPN